ncbi:TetR/AcrR family transcriptional regulator [Iamia majanohamensis]|uniref:TetR/AcrR family transcriptional regulator n=1 Tax=Iamia majanohamensis TaxID=467976 RepID=A0AAE9Y411_9ACTN|nr:TetR/AcrR family transcriptional regulator [Iamia majanohamensis]WCO65749.1 TetR/AcrR family transcriptional regulator [Iamia majanohamensis]
MGRIAGVSPEETRSRILASAAALFARDGYDGASIADIAGDAGLTTGAIYAHHASKAELFVAALNRYGSPQLERLLAFDDAGDDTLALISERGRALARRRHLDGSLLVEAIVAAQRHPEVGVLLTERFAGREETLAALLDMGKRTRVVDAAVPSEAVARFLVMLSLGSLLVAALDLPAVDDDDWATVIDDLVGRLGSGPTAPPPS